MRGIFDIARQGGDDIFIVYEDERWSFDEVFARVDALADALVNRYGIGKGDRVAIGMRNYPEWVMSMLAIISIGGVSVSLNALWVEDEIDYALADCGASLLIADDERIRTIDQPVPATRRAHARGPRRSAVGRRRRSVERRGRAGPGDAGGRCRLGRRRNHSLHLGHDGPAEGCGVDQRRDRVVGDGVRQPRRCRCRRAPQAALPPGETPPGSGPPVVHPDRAAVPRHRLRAGAAELPRLRSRSW